MITFSHIFSKTFFSSKVHNFKSKNKNAHKVIWIMNNDTLHIFYNEDPPKNAFVFWTIDGDAVCMYILI